MIFQNPEPWFSDFSENTFAYIKVNINLQLMAPSSMIIMAGIGSSFDFALRLCVWSFSCRKLNQFQTGFHTFNIATNVAPNFLKLYLLDPLQLVGLPHSFPPLCHKRQRLPKHLKLLRRFMLRLRWDYIHKMTSLASCNEDGLGWAIELRMDWAIEFEVQTCVHSKHSKQINIPSFDTLSWQNCHSSIWEKSEWKLYMDTMSHFQLRVICTRSQPAHGWEPLRASWLCFFVFVLFYCRIFNSKLKARCKIALH